MSRLSHVLFALIIAFACRAPSAEEPKAALPPYELHEWGVFLAPRNAAWANLDMKAEWSTMPKEFYGQLPGQFLPYHGPVFKPVIYFHAEKPMKLSLSIRFSDGMPTIWWPAAAHPVFTGLPNEKDRNLLVFQASLMERDPKDLVGPAGKVPRQLEVPAGHWIESLRQVQASEIFCTGSHSRAGTSCDTERFIYYDGLMKAPSSPKVERKGEAIVFELPGDERWLDVMAVERNGRDVRIGKVWGGWNEVLDAKIRRFTCEMSAASAEDLARVLKELGARLSAAGLHKDEAEALVNVWKEGLLGQDGLSLFYRIPQETYDKWLPLDAKPAPKKMVRVGLVLHRHLEPELDAQVGSLIKLLGSEAFEARDAARKSLMKIGGAAFPLLDEAAKGTELEIAKAAREILNALDARPLLTAPATQK